MGAGASSGANAKAAVEDASVDDLKAIFATLSAEEKAKVQQALSPPAAAGNGRPIAVHKMNAASSDASVEAQSTDCDEHDADGHCSQPSAPMMRVDGLEPLAHYLGCDWQALQTCALVCRAWQGVFRHAFVALVDRVKRRGIEIRTIHSANDNVCELQGLQNQSLSSIHKNDFSELMNWRNLPPDVVETFCLVVHLVLRHPTAGAKLDVPQRMHRARWVPAPDSGKAWPQWDAQDAVLKRCFTGVPVLLLEALKSLRVLDLPTSALEKALAWADAPYMDPDHMGKKTCLAGPLSRWLSSMMSEWRQLKADSPDAIDMLTLQRAMRQASPRKKFRAPSRITTRDTWAWRELTTVRSE